MEWGRGVKINEQKCNRARQKWGVIEYCKTTNSMQKDAYMSKRRFPSANIAIGTIDVVVCILFTAAKKLDRVTIVLALV